MTPLLRSLALALLLLAAPLAHAHLGSPDTYVQQQAGPYTVLLAIHPPAAYPGAMEVDLRASGITAAGVVLDDSKPQRLHVLDGNFTTTLWDPAPSAHTLRLQLTGDHGDASLNLSLPATIAPTAPAVVARSHWLVPVLFVLPILALYLFRESIANLARRRTYRLIAAALLVITLALVLYATRKPGPPPVTTVDASLSPTGLLSLTLTNPQHTFDDLVPDHGKLLHLFLIRQPRLDVFLHLHPAQTSPGHLQVQLPPMPPGAYTLYVDLYHATGLEETATLSLGLPAQSTGRPADPDDSFGNVAPLSTAQNPFPPPTPSPQTPNSFDRLAHLPDGYTLRLTTPAQLHPLNAVPLTVTLLDPSGNPPADMANYLGMAAHAVVLSADGRVFAHIHPGGTLPMIDAMPGMVGSSVNSSSTSNTPGKSMNQNGLSVPSLDQPHRIQPITLYTPPLPNTATIPYGFPTPGLYRLFVQMKHGNVVETAAFDLNVN